MYVYIYIYSFAEPIFAKYTYIYIYGESLSLYIFPKQIYRYGISRYCVKALAEVLVASLEARAIVACKNVSKIIGPSKTPRKSDKRKELLKKSR